MTKSVDIEYRLQWHTMRVDSRKRKHSCVIRKASAGTPPVFIGILDEYSADVGYSLRKLRKHYLKSIRVRRTNQIDPAHENNEQDFGFVDVIDAAGNCWLDIVELLAFVNDGAVAGLGYGYVTVVYDQSGNERHQTQTTAANQAVIVSAGVLEVSNTRPVYVTPNQVGYSVTANLATWGISADIMQAAYVAKHRAIGGLSNGFVFKLVSHASADRTRFASWLSAPNSRALLYMSATSQYGDIWVPQGRIIYDEDLFYAKLRQVFMSAQPQGAEHDMYLASNSCDLATAEQEADNRSSFHALPIRIFVVHQVTGLELPELIIYSSNNLAVRRTIAINQLLAWRTLPVDATWDDYVTWDADTLWTN